MKISYFLLAILFMSVVAEVQALECRGRIASVRNNFSNKCMTCVPINFNSPAQTNCKFQNTDQCCDKNSCSEANPHFSNWIKGVCVIPE